MGVLCNGLVGVLPYTWYTVRDTIIPLVRRKGSPRTKNDLTRPPAVVTAKKKRYPDCLAYVVRGVFYSVVANRRQPNLYSGHDPRGYEPSFIVPGRRILDGESQGFSQRGMSLALILSSCIFVSLGLLFSYL